MAMTDRPSPPITVLIADDQALARAGLRALLTSERVEIVGEASTGREACQGARELRPDVVLMDVNMPDMDGLAATEEIKREQPQVAVIIVTGDDDPGYLRRAVLAGAAGYVLKDASRSTILNAVEAVASGESIIAGHLLQGLLRELVSPEPLPVETAPLPDLTPTERETLRLVAQGLTNREIAQRMHYSPGTVKNTVQRILEKLGVSDRTQAAVVAMRSGLVAP